MWTDEQMSPTHRSIDLLIHIMRLHHRIVEKRIDDLGVHRAQHRMLMHLSKPGRSASQKQLARELDVSPACVARMLKPLCAAGLVQRTGGSDGRSNEVALLPEGQRLVEDSKTRFRRIESEMFRGFEESEIRALNAALERLRANLTAMEGAPRSEGPIEEKGGEAL